MHTINALSMMNFKNFVLRCSSAALAILLSPISPLTAAMKNTSFAVPATINTKPSSEASANAEISPDVVKKDESISAAYTYQSESLPQYNILHFARSENQGDADDEGENKPEPSCDEKKTLTDGAELFIKKWNGDDRVSFAFPPFSFLNSGGFPDAIAFLIEVGTEGETDDAVPTVTVTLTIETERGTFEFSAPVLAGSRSVFSADTSALPNDAEVALISVSFSRDPNSSASSAAVTSPVEPENVDFSAQNAMNIPSLAVIGGDISQKNGALIIEPFEIGDSSSSGNDSSDALGGNNGLDSARIFIPDYTYGRLNGERVLFSIEDAGGDTSADSSAGNDDDIFNAGSISSHSASVAYLTMSVSAEKSGVVSAGNGNERARALTTGDNDCILRFNISDDSSGLFLSFANAGIVSISSLIVYPTNETEYFEPLASLSELTVKGEDLKASGRLRDGALSILDKCSLRLYTVPFTGGTPILLGEMKAVSRFVFNVSLEDNPRAAAENYFYIAAVYIDSKKNESEIVITSPRFAYNGTETQNSSVPSSSSITGLHGCDPVGAYETGCSNVIIDVYLDRLVGGTEGGSVVSQGGHAFNLNDDYIASIDKDMRMYEAAGTAVSIRFLISKPMRNKDGIFLTIGRKGCYTLKADENEAIDMLVATVKFLCDRYTSIRTLILFSGIDSLYSGSFRTEWEAAENAGALMRMAYGAASEGIPGIYVTLPFDGIKAEEKGMKSDRILAALVAEKVSSLGGMPWAIMDSTDAPSSERLDSLISACRQTDRSIPSFGILMWTPYSTSKYEDIQTDVLCEEYKKLCDKSGASVRAIILSFEGNDGIGVDDYSRLKYIMKDNGATLLDKKVLTVTEFDLAEVIGSCRLWDFYSSYSPCGWLDGNGISSLGTSGVTEEKGSLTGERVLRCRMAEGGRGNAGILLNSLETPVNLSAAPYVEFDFVITDENNIAANAELVFIFHSKGGHRAEYRLESSEIAMDENGACRAVCDLSGYDYSSEINSIGIVIYSDGEEVFDLKRVTAHSYSIAEEELPNSIWRTENENVDNRSVDKIIASAFILAAVLFVSAGMITRLRRQDKEQN